MEPTLERLERLLGRLTNYERTRPARPRWSLESMRALLGRPGHVAPAGALVQVGGSKGKGTTALYLEALAAAAGLRTGTYTSPHLQSLLERVRVLGRQVGEAELRAAVTPIVAWAEASGLEVTFFEVMTAAALACFAACDVELGVLEVGLGGRLDATTAVPVAASIVTSIELEHTALLGDTVEAIAGEKAFVLRPDRPGFSAARGPALEVLRRHAAAVACRLQVLGADFELADVRSEGSGWRGVVALAGGRRLPFHLTDAAAMELPALALAVACMSELRPDLELPLQPVPRPELPGRCEVRPCADGQPLVLDGAHTEASTRALADELERRFPGRPVAVLFASATGKRWRESLKALIEKADRFRVAALADTATESPAEIVRWLRAHGVEADEVAGTAAGLSWLAEQARVRVVTGSFYLVGEARSQHPVFERLDLP